ncbi:COX15/CtaA family protein [Niabella drilacis]|uniref:Cytochrome c oxidase assembly protein subunit 15 n=1 Tax=Niabella drilacis (strain DSM 25811 / CCM 8410 / CCUG 62505 / LMG 26954 / E90) TaxID=1285928 RepID=A0A1G6N9B2_NIADE|nr:COX15/CtaA family protein [Niabella drilacis]SDC64393.1 cytochrome c oxidase assembly protein subunit 15 [Niabella drilacis]
MQLQKNRPVATWLFIGAGMLIIQVLLGGLTRLTGSGLSITEWQPILGALPPMNEQAWNEAFDKYKQIAQFRYIHNHFTLADFKGIYFWEWLHRDWARLIGIVFLIPFIWFVVKKKIDRSMLGPMIILFLLGGLQGAIGWIMVSSGVGTDLVYVSHIRLAIHFLAALLLLCYVVWFALKLTVRKDQIALDSGTRGFNILLLVVITLQLTYGAFMAGTHAGKASITWPTINGSMIPSASMLNEGGFWSDITHNLITIQFIHRGLAYLITVLMVFFTLRLIRLPKSTLLYKMRFLPVSLVLVQVVLGILALVHYLTPDKLLLSILHQLVGMLLLVCMVVTLFLVRKAAVVQERTATNPSLSKTYL